MKNAVIVILSLLLCFFILHSLGAFNFGYGVDRNHRAHFVAKRVKAAARAPHWLLGVSLFQGNVLSQDVVEGMSCAVYLVNAQGGSLNKPFQLEIRPVGPEPQSHRQAVQAFCDLPEAAVYFGPTHTLSVPSVRALSQFQGLPLISPFTPSDPLWPKLVPDNYVSLYPPLPLWSGRLADELEKTGRDKILILSPEQGSFGWLFANACQRDIGLRLPEAELFRLNYTAPLSGDILAQALYFYNENRGLDAIMFTGDASDLLVLDFCQRQMGLRIPVYGSDLLDIPDQEKNWAALSFPLFVPHCQMPLPSEAFAQAWAKDNSAPPSIWHILGAQAVFLTAQALGQTGFYHPDRLVEAVGELVEEAWRSQPPVINLKSFNSTKTDS